MNYPLVEFGSHEICENRDITFFTRNETTVSTDHINFKFSTHALAEVEI